MTDRDRSADRRDPGADGTGSNPGPTRGDRAPAHEEPTTNTRDRPPKPMTDETNPTEHTNRAATKSNRTSGANRPRRRVKDRDHTSPVDGHARTFERNNEGQRPKTDGGRRREIDEEATDEETSAVAEGAPTEDETASPGDGRVRRRVKDRDHTSPVDGHKRTFMRGDEDDADAK